MLPIAQLKVHFSSCHQILMLNFVQRNGFFIMLLQTKHKFFRSNTSRIVSWWKNPRVLNNALWTQKWKGNWGNKCYMSYVSVFAYHWKARKYHTRVHLFCFRLSWSSFYLNHAWETSDFRVSSEENKTWKNYCPSSFFLLSYHLFMPLLLNEQLVYSEIIDGLVS